MEAAVWSDVSRFLLDPQVLVDELLAESNDIESHAIAEAERDSLLANRSAVQERRTRAIDLYTRAKLSEVEFDAIAADVERELKTLDDRLAVLEPDDDVADDGLSEHVLTEIRQRLTGDLSDSERREIVQLLVRRITVHTHHPHRPAAPSRSASLSTTASRREVRLTRASLRVTATISHALSLPEPESPRHRPHPAPRISAYFPRLRFTELDSCRVAVASTRVTLRSVAPALPLQ